MNRRQFLVSLGCVSACAALSIPSIRGKGGPGAGLGPSPDLASSFSSQDLVAMRKWNQEVEGRALGSTNHKIIMTREDPETAALAAVEYGKRAAWRA